jgi:hypothetical protein
MVLAAGFCKMFSFYWHHQDPRLASWRGLTKKSKTLSWAALAFLIKGQLFQGVIRISRLLVEEPVSLIHQPQTT